MLRTVIALCMAFVTCALSIAQSWDDDYVRALFDGRDLYPIEGVWQFPANGASVAVVKSSDYTFDIHLLDSPRLDIKPGTVVGSARITPKDGYYDAELTPKAFGAKHKIKKQRVTFTVNDNGTLSMLPYKTGWSISFKRWISYFMRITVEDNSNRRPKDLDGAVRIYPNKPSDKSHICL